MTDVISPALLNGVGVVGLLVALFWMLSTGKLIVGTQYQEKARECDDWKQAFFAEQAAHRETTDQNGELLETNRLTQASLEALTRVAGGGRT